MSSSAEHRPELTLKDVVEIASASTLVSGGHIPTVIAEGEKGSVIAHIDEIAPSFEERAHQMFVLGALLARTGEIGVLQQAFFISEAWVSLGSPDKPPILPPSSDPQRKEVLIVAQLDVRQARTEFEVREMRRDEQGTLKTLESFPRAEGQMTTASPLLDAFAAGFLGRRRGRSKR